MPPRELTRPYEPNLALRLLYKTVFDRIQIDETWVRQVRQLAHEGSVVYVLRNLNFIDFFALDHLTKRYALPEIRFANDLGLWVLSPMGKGWLNAIFPRRDVTRSDELKDALERGGSAALFLKRPPTALEVTTGRAPPRGLSEGDGLLRALLALQATRDKPIRLVPQVFIWTKEPDSRGAGTLDRVLGATEAPTPLRTVGQYLYNYNHVSLRAGEPIDLAEFLRDHPNLPEDVQLRRITYGVLRRLERERRSVVGPAQKPPDRVRLEIVRSPRLKSTIRDLAGERAMDRTVLTGRALGMLRELAATPDVNTIKGLEAIFHRVFHRIYAGIEYDKPGLERVREACKEGTLVLLPSHKSHIDYLILSYVFNEENLQLPLIAAGDNLNFFPVGAIFRRGGAFFIRRSFKGDKLYAVVVDAYIRRLIRDGYPIELFLEGGRSRTGKLLTPKYGLLSMIVDAADAVEQRTTYFVPVSIGYERVIEAASYQRELTGGEKRKEDARELLKTPEVLRHRYGRINLQFGELLSLAQIRDELGLEPGSRLTPAKRRAVVTRLGNRVMDEINQVTAVTPGALTALSLLCHERRGLPYAELVERSARLLGRLRAEGARVTPTTQTPGGTLRAEAIREAVEMFRDAELVEVHLPGAADGEERRPKRRQRPPIDADSIINPVEQKRLTLDSSKNIVVHFFVERALVASALGMPHAARPTASESVLRERVQSLSRLFKFEFRFRADAPFDRIFDETLGGMLTDAVLARAEDGAIVAGAGLDGWTGHDWLGFYGSVLTPFLEGYRIAARGLSALLKGALSEKELVKKSLVAGNKMFFSGEVSRREAICKPMIENAIASFVEQGYLARDDGKLRLAESFQSTEAAQAIEGRLTGYLGVER
ncbi:MAG: 1-acyl-sn-glycerol-3-phosphate acyltransferase [Polyangiaceae bacterium]|nr:1-acyl-sn-glycerol-3-phosphate acyltransferase [Polyangiaceae bacterium]